MRLCFDATRFGYGLKEAVGLAALKGLPAVEFTFEPFETTTAESRTLAGPEQEFLDQVKTLAAEKAVEIACLNLDHTLVPEDRSSVKSFHAMLTKLSRVARAAGCPRLSFAMEPAAGAAWLSAAEKCLTRAIGTCARQDVGLILRLSTPEVHRGRSLKSWRPLDPGDWRELLAAVPGLSLSLSPADCVWLGVDYLQMLPSFIPAIEHIEANDIEINQDMVRDAGLFGPLWWRYRLPGKGQLDWRQLIEALKLYGYSGAVSIRLDDEFIGNQVVDLDRALDAGIAYLSPLVKG